MQYVIVLTEILLQPYNFGVWLSAALCISLWIKCPVMEEVCLCVCVCGVVCLGLCVCSQSLTTRTETSGPQRGREAWFVSDLRILCVTQPGVSGPTTSEEKQSFLTHKHLNVAPSSREMLEYKSTQHRLKTVFFFIKKLTVFFSFKQRRHSTRTWRSASM